VCEHRAALVLEEALPDVHRLDLGDQDEHGAALDVADIVDERVGEAAAFVVQGDQWDLRLPPQPGAEAGLVGDGLPGRVLADRRVCLDLAAHVPDGQSDLPGGCDDFLVVE